jgi:hypothetical protein
MGERHAILVHIASCRSLTSPYLTAVVLVLFFRGRFTTAPESGWKKRETSREPMWLLSVVATVLSVTHCSPLAQFPRTPSKPIAPHCIPPHNFTAVNSSLIDLGGGSTPCCFGRGGNVLYTNSTLLHLHEVSRWQYGHRLTMLIARGGQVVRAMGSLDSLQCRG